MCFSKWFGKKKVFLTLPYPEEPPDYTQTVENTIIEGVILDWLRKYQVPLQNWDWWKTKIVMHLYNWWPDNILAKYSNIKGTNPAFTVEENGQRNLYCLVPFYNVGVVAHEQAHNSWTLLTEVQRREFAILYNQFKTTDSFIVLLRSIKEKAMYNDDEIHSELYRYLNDKMPESLKQFYPKLI